jgi:hypothetical protein
MSVELSAASKLSDLIPSGKRRLGNLDIAGQGYSTHSMSDLVSVVATSNMHLL